MHLSIIVLVVVCLVPINTRPRYRILSSEREIYFNLANPPIDFNPMYSKEERQGQCPAYKPRICTGRSMEVNLCQYDDDCLHHSKCCKDYCYPYKVCIRVQMDEQVLTSEPTTMTSVNVPRRTTWSEYNEIPTGDLDPSQTESPNDYAIEDDYYYIDIDDVMTLPPEFTTEEGVATTEEDYYTENETTIEETTTEEIETTTIEETETTPEETTIEETETTTEEIASEETETTIEETETTPEETTFEETETTPEETTIEETETTIEETETTPEETTTEETETTIEETETTTPEETTTEETVETTATTVQAETEEATEETESEDEYDDYTTAPEDRTTVGTTSRVETTTADVAEEGSGSGSGDDAIDDNEDDYDESEYVSNESEEDAGKPRVEKETDMNGNKGRDAPTTASTTNAEEIETEIDLQNTPYYHLQVAPDVQLVPNKSIEYDSVEVVTISGKDEAVEPVDVIENGTRESEHYTITVSKFDSTTVGTTYRVETTTVGIVEEGSGSGDRIDDTEDDYDEEEDADKPIVEKETEVNVNKSLQNAQSSKVVPDEAESFDYDSEEEVTISGIEDEEIEETDGGVDRTVIEMAKSEVDGDKAVGTENGLEHLNESVDEVEANTKTYQVDLEQDVELSETVEPHKQLDVEVEKVLLQKNTEQKQVVTFTEPSIVSKEAKEESNVDIIDSDWRMHNASERYDKEHNRSAAEESSKSNDSVVESVSKEKVDILDENEEPVNLSVPPLEIQNKTESAIEAGFNEELTTESVKEKVKDVVTRIIDETTTARFGLLTTWLVLGGTEENVEDGEINKAVTNSEGIAETSVEERKIATEAEKGTEIEKTELMDYDYYEIEDLDGKGNKEQAEAEDDRSRQETEDKKKNVEKERKKLEKDEKKTENKDKKKTEKKDETKTEKKDEKKTDKKKTDKKDDKKTEKKVEKKTEKKVENKTEKKNEKKTAKKDEKKTEKKDKKKTEKNNEKETMKNGNKKLEETDKKTMGKKQKGKDDKELEEIDIDEATEKVKSKPKEAPVEEKINRNEDELDEASGSGSGDDDAIPDDYGDDYEEQFSGDKANP